MNTGVQGLLLNMIGVIILFYYGMPFRLPTNGEVGLIIEQIDEKAKQDDLEYQSTGYIGFVCVIAGTVMQMAAAWT